MNKRGNSADDCFPKFFKVYLADESGDDLELPISFNSFLPKSLPKNVIVRSIYGNVWKMAFRKCCGDIDKFAMVNGWKRIVKDEDLKGGEFLEFEFDGSWLFNFCIYGRATCKKLRNSVQTREVKDECHGHEYDISSDEVTFLDDDDDDDIGDVNDDQEYGDENIIVVDDDDDVQDYNKEDKSSKDIIVIDDDDADNDDIKNYGEEDTSSEDITVGDDDDDEDYGYDDYTDDENERRRGIETERKEKGPSGVSKKCNNEDDRQYLDNDMNPFFTVNQNLQRKTDLRVPAKVIKNYDLHFAKFIYLIDPLEKKSGILKRKIEGHTIKGFERIITRNKVRSTDKMICELEMEMNGLVRKIKVHVIRW